MCKAGDETVLDLASVSQIDFGALENTLRTKLENWRGLLSRHVAQARQIVRKVLADRLTFTPRTEGTHSYYEFEGQGRLEPLLSGVIPALLPKGDQVLQRWWPQRDSLARFGRSR